jgi:hypothetical protein
MPHWPQSEAMLIQGNHGQRDRKAGILSLQMLRLQPETEAGVLDFGLTVPEARAQVTLDPQMIELQFDSRTMPGKIPPHVTRSNMQSRDAVSAALGCDNHNAPPLGSIRFTIGLSGKTQWRSPAHLNPRLPLTVAAQAPQTRRSPPEPFLGRCRSKPLAAERSIAAFDIFLMNSLISERSAADSRASQEETSAKNEKFAIDCRMRKQASASVDIARNLNQRVRTDQKHRAGANSELQRAR